MAMTEAPFWEPTAGRGSRGILILSYLVLSCLILSYLVLSCLILSYLVLSCLILSYLVFASDAAVIVWLCVARRRLDVGGHLLPGQSILEIWGWSIHPSAG